MNGVQRARCVVRSGHPQPTCMLLVEHVCGLCNMHVGCATCMLDLATCMLLVEHACGLCNMPNVNMYFARRPCVVQKELKAVHKMIRTEVQYRTKPVVQLASAEMLDDAAQQQRKLVDFAMQAVVWLCKADTQTRPKAPVVADTALKLGLVVLKLGRFTSKAMSDTGPNDKRTEWWMIMVAAMKHCGIFGTVVRAYAAELVCICFVAASAAHVLLCGLPVVQALTEV